MMKGEKTMKQYPTPHIDATPGDFAKTVLMPGDPLRAKFVAENFLENARLVNNVRGIHGYTGTYHGTPVSVMASGMGMPSIGIYSYELYNFFGVENILRIGSAGAMAEKVAVRDLVLGMGASTNSRFADQYKLPGTYAPICDYTLLSLAVREAEAQGVTYHVGNLLSSDTFYSDDSGDSRSFAKMGVLAVEMEAAALYMTAARAGKRALAICTISDHIVTGEALPAAERQTSFTDMMEVALRTAIAADSLDK
jgi:purine-nucleoside phosphorylase